MKQRPHERAVALALYITEKRSTVRAAAAAFGVSKSTVHKDVTKALRRLDPDLYDATRKVLEQNKEERHIRGGEATRRKYRGEI
ncbi:MAG: sporulation transcriptional regulator SpoIIID [Clostridia bacterium]|nr:sporulation transcriptional regulator SpoIIID [Clostridia bacterium]